MLPKNRKPTHPGKILFEEYLKPLGIKQVELAKHLGLKVQHLHGVIKGRCRLHLKMALSLADVLGLDAKYWIGLQADWDIWHARKTHKKKKPLKL